jgi:hypothetical protein
VYTLHIINCESGFLVNIELFEWMIKANLWYEGGQVTVVRIRMWAEYWKRVYD